MATTKYTARATSTGGRNGHGRTDDGALDVTLTTPKESGGDGAPGTNPEQLFAIGYSACFLGALKAAGRKAGVKVPEDSTVTASVSLLDRDDGVGFWISAALSVHVPGVEKSVAEQLVQAAHQICPYSESSRKGFEVKLTVA